EWRPSAATTTRSQRTSAHVSVSPRPRPPPRRPSASPCPPFSASHGTTAASPPSPRLRFPVSPRLALPRPRLSPLPSSPRLDADRPPVLLPHNYGIDAVQVLRRIVLDLYLSLLIPFRNQTNPRTERLFHSADRGRHIGVEPARLRLDSLALFRHSLNHAFHLPHGETLCGCLFGECSLLSFVRQPQNGAGVPHRDPSFR